MPPARGYQTMEAPSMTAVTAEAIKLPKQTHKRKRDSPEQNGNGRQRGAPGQVGTGSTEVIDDLLLGGDGDDFENIGQQLARHVANATPTAPSTAAAALAARVPHLTVPQPTELSFQSTSQANDDEPADSSFDLGGADGAQNSHGEGAPYNVDAYAGNGAARSHASTGGDKPPVGSEEWHKQRKDSHKEVERRRRETINEGINELAKIVPGDDKNKGAILQRGVNYITSLKENEKRNIEKWTLEKLLTDQAISELSSSNDKLKNELERAYNEAAKWKKRCQDAGLVSKDNEGTLNDNSDDA